MHPENTKEGSESQAHDAPFLFCTLDIYGKHFNTCPYATTLKAWSDHFKAIVVIALTCKRWGCRYCGQKKALKLAERTATANPNRLITLTVNPAVHCSPRVAYESTTKKLPLLARKIRRDHDEFEYLRVLEVTKKGWPHFHLVARSPFIRQHYISDVWSELTGAPIVDIRKIRKHNDVFTYVMKYLCKQKYIPWTNRRVSWTRNFFPPKVAIEKGKWKLEAKAWNDRHPVDVIAEKYDGQICQKIAADAWSFRIPKETEHTDQIQRSLPSSLVSGVLRRAETKEAPQP